MDKFVLETMLLAVEDYEFNDGYTAENIAELVNNTYGFNFKPHLYYRYPLPPPRPTGMPSPVIASIYGPIIQEQLSREANVLKLFQKGGSGAT